MVVLLLTVIVSLVNFSVGVTASCFGLGATLSNFLGQMVVEKFDHATSLMASLVISLVPIVIFLFMPETLGMRTQKQSRGGEEPTKSLLLADTSTSYGSTTDNSSSPTSALLL